MTANLSRREFTCFSAAAVSCSPISAWAQQLTPAHVFFHQTGGPENAYFYLGAVITDNPQEHRDAMNSMRQATKYDRVLYYKSSDKYKYEFCCRLIDYFLRARNIRFLGGRVNLKHWPDSSMNKDIVYFGVHKKLLDFSGFDAKSSLHVHMLNRGFRLRSRSLNLFKKFETELPWKTMVTWNHSEEEPLLQVANFLTGSLQDRSNDGTKQRLLVYLRQALKVDHLTEANLRDNRVFRIRQILG